jgi:hypothetical protein
MESPLKAVGVKVKEIGCDPKLTVVPPLMVAAVEPVVVPVPLALNVVLLLKAKTATADTSKVAPAAMEIVAELLMEPVLPKASVPALMVVAPV